MDIKLFDLLYNKYSQPMLLYALTFVNSKSDTEDIVQEVFYNFWKSEAYLRVPIDEARPWLLRAIKNACINFWEKKDVLAAVQNCIILQLKMRNTPNSMNKYSHKSDRTSKTCLPKPVKL